MNFLKQHLSLVDTIGPENIFAQGRDRNSKILVIDDDPIFLRRVSQFAKGKGLSLTVCKSLEELAKIPNRNSFDVALVDYYLDEHLVGATVAEVMGAIPVVMMSSIPEGAIYENDIWPRPYGSLSARKQA